MENGLRAMYVYYVLGRPWIYIVRSNGLREDDVIQLLVFKVGE